MGWLNYVKSANINMLDLLLSLALQPSVVSCKITVSMLFMSYYIMKTGPCNVYPLEPHFYIVKLAFAGVYLFFFFFALKHRLWVLVRTASPRRFLCVPTIYVLSKNKKNNKNFLLKIFIFCAFKNLCILHGQVFIMIFSEIHLKYLKTLCSTITMPKI